MPEKSLLELLNLAKGDRSLNTFAQHANVSAGNLSRVFNGQKPTPELLKKIALKAYNGVTYTQLMEAAGYIESDSNFGSGENAIEENSPAQQAEEIIKIDPDLFVQMCRATYLPEEDRKKIREYSAMLLEKHLREQKEKEKGKKGNDISK